MQPRIPLIVLTAAASVLRLPAAVPLSWTVETSRAQPATFEAYQGETLTFEAALQSHGKPLEAPLNYSFFWQTNGMGSTYWEAPCPTNYQLPATNLLRATWLPAYDVGAKVYNCFIGSPSNIYHAAFQLRIRPSPGALPNALPLPTPVIDFARVRVLNPPWPGSARQLPKYLHLLDFDDSYPADAAWYYSQPQDYGSCSAVRDGNTLSRNYDWKFDEAAEFIVRMSSGPGRFASVGVANCGTNLTEQFVTSGKPSRYFKCLPGHTVDGINEHGVVAEINVVDGAPAWHTTGDIHPLAAVRWALDNATNAQHAASNLAARITFPQGWSQNFHYMIADETATYIVENGAFSNVTGRAVMTNFPLLPTPTYGSGWERYNLLLDGENITKAWFTQCYDRSTNPPWLSEFDNNYEHWIAALNAWERLGTMEARRATGAFWQSVHTSIYDLTNRTLRVAVQETDDWYTFAVPMSKGIKTETDPTVPAWAKQDNPPAAPVQSVNGKTGAVTLNADEVPYAGAHSLDTVGAALDEHTGQIDTLWPVVNGKADRSDVDQMRTEFAGRMRFLVSEKTTTDHNWDTGSGWGAKDPLYTAVTGEGRGAYAAIAPSLNGGLELTFMSEPYEEDPIRDSYNSYYGSMYWRTNALDNCQPDVTAVKGYQSASQSSPYTGYTHIEATFTLPAQTYYYDYGGGDVTHYEAYRIPLHFSYVNDLAAGYCRLLSAWCDTGTTISVDAGDPSSYESRYYTCFGFYAYVSEDDEICVSYNWERYDYYTYDTITGSSYFYVNVSNPNRNQTRMVCFGDRGSFATADSVGGMIGTYINNNDIVKSVLKTRTGKDGELGDGPGYLLYNWNSDTRSWRLAVPRLDVTLSYAPQQVGTNVVCTRHFADGREEPDTLRYVNLPGNPFIDKFAQGGVMSRVVSTHGTQGTDGCSEAVVDFRAYDTRGGDSEWSSKLLGARVAGLTYGEEQYSATYSPAGDITNIVFESVFSIHPQTTLYRTEGRYVASNFSVDPNVGITYDVDCVFTNAADAYFPDLRGKQYYYGSFKLKSFLGMSFTRYPTQMKAIDTPVVRMATVDTAHYYWDENLRCTMQLRLRNGCLVLEKVSDRNLTLEDAE